MMSKRGREATKHADSSAHPVISSMGTKRQASPVVRKNAVDQEPPMRILLAEDSAVYRHLIGGHLQEWGFNLQIANDGAAAWELLQAPNAPRLVLLDWELPKIDGIQLCRRIRQAQSDSNYTYIVLLTGKDGKDDIVEGMRAGADDYLAKPFHPSELDHCG